MSYRYGADLPDRTGLNTNRLSFGVGRSLLIRRRLAAIRRGVTAAVDAPRVCTVWTRCSNRMYYPVLNEPVTSPQPVAKIVWITFHAPTCVGQCRMTSVDRTLQVAIGADEAKISDPVYSARTACRRERQDARRQQVPHTTISDSDWEPRRRLAADVRRDVDCAGSDRCDADVATAPHAGGHGSAHFASQPLTLVIGNLLLHRNRGR